MWFLILMTIIISVNGAPGIDEYEYVNVKINLESDKSEKLLTLNYPETAPANLRHTWEYTTEPQNKIKIQCEDFRIYDRKPCPEDYAFRIHDGNHIEEICGAEYNYKYISQQSSIKITFGTDNYGGAFIDCTVKAFSNEKPEEPLSTENPSTVTNEPDEVNWNSDRREYLKDKSLEIDSTEYGVSEGSRKTSCKCGWANKAGRTRIVGGEEAEVNEYPFTVALVNQNERFPWCGGTIISPYHVITAAHCANRNEQKVAVVVGEHDYLSDTETNYTKSYNVANIIPHPLYNSEGTSHYDISLLVLEKPIEFNQFVGPACLPTEKLNLVGNYFKVVGWGLQENSFDPSILDNSEKLKKVFIRNIHLKYCLFEFGRFVDYYKNPHQLCVYASKRGMCFGDSGGSAMWLDPETNRYTLVGVPSYVRTCIGLAPAVVTDVSVFTDWIQQHMKETMPNVSSCHKL